MHVQEEPLPLPDMGMMPQTPLPLTPYPTEHTPLPPQTPLPPYPTSHTPIPPSPYPQSHTPIPPSPYPLSHTPVPPHTPYPQSHTPMGQPMTPMMHMQGQDMGQDMMSPGMLPPSTPGMMYPQTPGYPAPPTPLQHIEEMPHLAADQVSRQLAYFFFTRIVFFT